MGIYGVPWLLIILEFVAGPGMLIAAIVLVQSKWWKHLTDYYFSWNSEREAETAKEGGNTK